MQYVHDPWADFLVGNFSGFNALSDELAKYSQQVDKNIRIVDDRDRALPSTVINGERLRKALQQMLFSSMGSNNAEQRVLLEEYIKYKKAYVKHLQFNPDSQNLSKKPHHLH